MSQSWKGYSWQLRLVSSFAISGVIASLGANCGMGDVWRQLLAIALGGACVFSASCATAQITPDRTLPNNSSVTINGSVFNITGGTQAGRNLFHSFQQFSVPTGGTASFINGADINNIISRVTGGSASNIDGLIKASGTANLFFLNPSGIVFGQHASLNIGGSFVATTANAIQFGNQGTFSASVPDNPALLTINPSALLYNQIAAGASIQNSSLQAGLQVPDGKSLLLVGGDINMDGGGLTASGGRVELAGLAAPGTVGLNVAGNTLSLSVPSGVQRSDVSLSNQAFIDVSGAGGGDIAVNARNLNVLSNSALFAGIGTGLGNGSSTKAGDININADAISVESGEIDNEVYSSTSKGNAGNINITTGSLSTTNGGYISSNTNGNGNSGNISITARNSISFDGVDSNGNISGAFSNVYPSAVGNGGNINITAGSLSLTGGSQISASTSGTGSGGSIEVKAADSVQVNGSDASDNPSGLFTTTSSQGAAGNLTIETGQLIVQNGANVSASTDPGSQGHGGMLKVTASNFVKLIGTSVDGSFPSGLFAQTRGTGDAGLLTIDTHSLIVENGAEVTVGANLGSQGNGGDLIVRASDSVELSGKGRSVASALSSRTRGLGNAGSLTINTGQLTVHNGAQVTVASLGSGNAGNLNITAGSTRLDNQGTITAGTMSGQGGDITIDLRDVLVLQRNSQISAIAGTPLARGNGGNITINAPSGFVVATPNENNDITANAFFGSGGRIQIKALGIYNFNQRSFEDLENLLGTNDPNKLDPQKLPTNDITAISLTNPILSGSVNIITPDIDPSRGLVNLPTVTENTPMLVSTICKAFNEKAGGSNFTITGSGGLPPSPYEPLTNDIVWSDTRLPVTAQHQHKTHAAKSKPKPIAIVPATGWVFNGKGEVTLISSVTNATSGSTFTSCPVW
ncbi:MAG: filamentous hemagglutinin N-terminal domain-containing protein [Rhizonema sp. PD38]|nr:filamentous hemagglutinin N-terminal domain-containing protein [Rhizonema sp. PD38]